MTEVEVIGKHSKPNMPVLQTAIYLTKKDCILKQENGSAKPIEVCCLKALKCGTGKLVSMLQLSYYDTYFLYHWVTLYSAETKV